MCVCMYMYICFLFLAISNDMLYIIYALFYLSIFADLNGVGVISFGFFLRPFGPM